MTHLDLLIGLARDRGDDFLRQAAEGRLAAAARSTQKQRGHHVDPVRRRRRSAGSTARRSASQVEAGAAEL
jgi:hypothetical protein